MSEVLVRAEALRVSVPEHGSPNLLGRSRQREILHGIDLSIAPGECVGIVGESGSGKTTLGRCLVRLLRPSAGRLHFAGRDIGTASEAMLRPLRPRFQMIFQNPLASLNPRRCVLDLVAAPAMLHDRPREARERARVALGRVGLGTPLLSRYPHELSGGQRQRVGIARAIVGEPDFIVADEVVSGLDVTTRAEILFLLHVLRRDLGLALAFIAHDLAVVQSIADRVIVMRDGGIVEAGSAASLFGSPRDAYTRRLLAAVPSLEVDPSWLDAPGDQAMEHEPALLPG